MVGDAAVGGATAVGNAAVGGATMVGDAAVGGATMVGDAAVGGSEGRLQDSQNPMLCEEPRAFASDVDASAVAKATATTAGPTPDSDAAVITEAAGVSTTAAPVPAPANPLISTSEPLSGVSTTPAEESAPSSKSPSTAPVEESARSSTSMSPLPPDRSEARIDETLPPAESIYRVGSGRFSSNVEACAVVAAATTATTVAPAVNTVPPVSEPPSDVSITPMEELAPSSRSLSPLSPDDACRSEVSTSSKSAERKPIGHEDGVAPTRASSRSSSFISFHSDTEPHCTDGVILSLGGLLQTARFVTILRRRAQSIVGQTHLAKQIGAILHLFSVAYISSIVFASAKGNGEEELFVLLTHAMSTAALLLQIAIYATRVVDSRLLWAHYAIHCCDAPVDVVFALMRNQKNHAIYNAVWTVLLYPCGAVALHLFLRTTQALDAVTRDAAAKRGIFAFASSVTPLAYFLMNGVLCLNFSLEPKDECSTRIHVNSAAILAIVESAVLFTILVIQPVTLEQLTNLRLSWGQIAGLFWYCVLLVLALVLHSQNETFARATPATRLVSSST